VFIEEGLHVPEIPLVEDVDKVPGKSFWQYGPSCVNVGLTGVEMVTVMV
jgi:hypothetical protein